MNTTTLASLDDIMNIFSDYLNEEDIIYSKVTAKLVSCIIKERKRLSLSQADFANHLCTKQSVISRWESGNSNFTIKTLSKIAAKLDLDLYVNLIPHSDIEFVTTGKFIQANIHAKTKPLFETTINSSTKYLYKSKIGSNWKEISKC